MQSKFETLSVSSFWHKWQQAKTLEQDPRNALKESASYSAFVQKIFEDLAIATLFVDLGPFLLWMYGLFFATEPLYPYSITSILLVILIMLPRLWVLIDNVYASSIATSTMMSHALQTNKTIDSITAKIELPVEFKDWTVNVHTPEVSSLVRIRSLACSIFFPAMHSQFTQFLRFARASYQVDPTNKKILIFVNNAIFRSFETFESDAQATAILQWRVHLLLEHAIAAHADYLKCRLYAQELYETKFEEAFIKQQLSIKEIKIAIDAFLKTMQHWEAHHSNPEVILNEYRRHGRMCRALQATYAQTAEQYFILQVYQLLADKLKGRYNQNINYKVSLTDIFMILSEISTESTHVLVVGCPELAVMFNDICLKRAQDLKCKIKDITDKLKDSLKTSQSF